MRSIALPIAVLLAAVIGHHAYYWMADYGWPIGPASRAATGVELLMLYGSIGALMLWPLRSLAARAAVFVIVLYGMTEAAQVVVCQSARAITRAELKPTMDACDALLGVPFGSMVVLVWGVCVLTALDAAIRRVLETGVAFTATGNYTGYVPVVGGPWKVLAAVFTWPFAGKVWFVQGVGYRFDRTVRSMVQDDTLRPDDYHLREFEGDASQVRVGMRWTLRNNCVTLG